MREESALRSGVAWLFGALLAIVGVFPLLSAAEEFAQRRQGPAVSYPAAPGTAAAFSGLRASANAEQQTIAGAAAASDAEDEGKPAAWETIFAAPDPGEAGNVPPQRDAAACDLSCGQCPPRTGTCRSLAPNMIGDIFAKGQMRTSVQPATIWVPPVTRSYAGYFKNPGGDPQAMSATLSGGHVVVTAPGAITLNGDVSITLPPPVSWTSRDPYAAIPPTTFMLAENAAETLGTQQAFPTAQSVIFNNGRADPDLAHPGSFNVFTDYTIIYQQGHYVLGPTIVILMPTPGGGVVGRGKIADNDSPIPRDRVFLDYDYLHHAPLIDRGVGVNRFAPGFEKTFSDGRASVEMRFPVAATLASQVVADGPTGSGSGAFGNIELIFKRMLVQTDRTVFTAGLEITAPTAEDIGVRLSDGTPLVRIENGSVHLMPFFGLLVEPNERWYFQSFVQVDVDANGNRVLVNRDGTGLIPAGSLNDQTLMFFDVAVGRWLYRSPDQSSRISGLVGTIEVHYTASTSNMNWVHSGNFVIGDPTSNVSIVDLTVGGHLLVGKSVLTVGYGTPLSSDRSFDGELRVLLNRYF